MAAQDDNLTRKNSSANVTDDREAHPKFWVAAYTRPRSEKKAANEIAKSGIETYVPIQRQLKTWSDRMKYVDIVVIPMVIFAYISEEDIATLRQNPLIISILSYPDKRIPAKIPEEHIKNLKKVLSQSQSIVNFTPERFSSHDKVIVIKGGLRGLVGEVKESFVDMTTVWISVDLLGGVEIKINSSDLEHYKGLLHHR